MDRRTMLKGGAGAAGVAGVGVFGQGCAHQAGTTAAAEPTPLPPQALIDDIVGRLDRRLAWIDRQKLPDELAPAPGEPLTPERQAQADRFTHVFRKSMRTLYVTGRFMDLPDEIKTHPDIQARVLAAQPEMDEAVFGTTELLDSLRPEDHRAIQATLRDRPRLGEQLAVLLEGPAREDGIPFKRRMGLRTTTLQLAGRMEAQTPSLTIDPYVRRVRKLAAQPHGDDRTARLLAARMGEEAFWRHQHQLAALSSRWQRQIAQAGPPSSGGTTAPSGGGAATPSAPAAPAAGRTTVGSGGRIMGFGAGSIGVGLIFAGLSSALSAEALMWPALIFGVTVGPILLLIGLIVIIVGGIRGT